MKLLHIFNTEHYTEHDIKQMEVREATRAIILDDNDEIAILHNPRGDFYSLPGGGVEKSETLQEGCMRECWEETGCRVEIIKELGQIDEVRGKNKTINRSVGFVAKVVGAKGPLNLDKDELDEGTTLLWTDIDEAIKLISDFSDDISLYSKYSQERDIIFLTEFKR